MARCILSLIISLVWLSHAHAYIQNGFTSKPQYKAPSAPVAPPTIQTSSVPETLWAKPQPEAIADVPAPSTEATPDEVTSSTPADSAPVAVPIPRPRSERPATPAATPASAFRAEATTKALGVIYRGSQPATQLTSCGALKFGVNGRCEPINVAKDFAPVLLEQIPKCVNQALRLDHEAPAASIFIEHMGTYQNRNVSGSSRASMHSTGRAIDVSKIIIKTTSGKTITHKMTIGSRREAFYSNFNKCWTTYQGTKAQCHPKGGGMIDCRDPDHHDHVHLSLPFCPRKSGISAY
jgi:hypothetical protein